MSTSAALDLEGLVDPVVEMVESAGREIMRIYAQDFSVETKGDDSPLTQADLASHDVLVDALEALPSDWPVLSEESADVSYDVRSKWSTYWLVDPLDGTKEFIAKNGEFTVNVALIHEHRAVFGVVGVPARGEVFIGFNADTRRAVRRHDGEERRIDTCPLPPRLAEGRPLRVVASRSHGSEALEKLLAEIGGRYGEVERVPVGSALKFCILATGDADLYPRLGPTSEWDTAAAHAVLEAAGGAVRTLGGEPLVYNSKDSLLNPFFVAVADADHDWGTLFAPYE
jgi:3'(2'), 5'-bisphosphate nucleotidase